MPVNQSSVKMSQNNEYFSILLILFIFGLSHSITLQAIPAAVLLITDNEESTASYYMGIAIFLRYSCEFLSSPFLGTISDLYGRKPVLILSFVANTFQLLLFSLYQNIPILLTSFAVAGFGAFVGPASYAIITDISRRSGDIVAHKYGLMAGTMGFSIVIGSFLSGVVITFISTVASLYLAAGLSALAAAVAGIYITESNVTVVIEKKKNPNERKREKGNTLSKAIAAVELQEACSPLVSQEEASQIITEDSVDPRHNAESAISPCSATETSYVSSPQLLLDSAIAHDTERAHEESYRTKIDSNIGKKHHELHNEKAVKLAAAIADAAVASIGSSIWIFWFSVKSSMKKSLAAMKSHYTNQTLRQLTIPFALAQVASTSMFIFFIYAEYRYSASAFAIGTLMSFVGILSVVVVGFLMQHIVPSVWDESTTLLCTLPLHALAAFSFAFVPEFWGLYIAAAVFSPGFMFEPVIKSMLVQSSFTQHGELAEHNQGNLQGVLNSVHTVSLALGILLNSVLFSVGVAIKPHPVPYLPFLCSGFLYLLALISLRRILLTTD